MPNKCVIRLKKKKNRQVASFELNNNASPFTNSALQIFLSVSYELILIAYDFSPTPVHQTRVWRYVWPCVCIRSLGSLRARRARLTWLLSLPRATDRRHTHTHTHIQRHNTPLLLLLPATALPSSICWPRSRPNESFLRSCAAPADFWEGRDICRGEGELFFGR